MYKHYFEGIENIEWAPIVSLVLFFVFFVGMIIMVFKTDSSFFNKMKQLPLDDAKPKSDSIEIEEP